MTFQHASATFDAGIPDLREIYVPIDRDVEFQTFLLDLMQQDENGASMAAPKHFTSTKETRGVMVVAKSGSGKTSMIHRALSKMEVFGSGEEDKKPWIAVRVPSPATTKGLGIEILEQSG